MLLTGAGGKDIHHNVENYILHSISSLCIFFALAMALEFDLIVFTYGDI